VVNILDTLALKNHIVEGKTIEGYNYDTNNDGTSNKVDVIQSKRSTFGLDNFSYYNDGVYDEYTPFDYSIFDSDEIDNYFHSRFEITLKHQYSPIDIDYTINGLIYNTNFFLYGIDNLWFPEDLNCRVFFSTEAKNEYLEGTTYRKIILVRLQDSSNLKIKDVISEIENSNIAEIEKIELCKIVDNGMFND
jgi:hypothetical protein